MQTTRFEISPVRASLRPQLQAAVDGKTKPVGALGELERIAVRIGCLQNTLAPRIERPSLVVFAGDHGAADSGVSAYPSDVTAQMVRNFLSGGAAINVFARRHGWSLSVVDAGVKAVFDTADLPAHSGVALLCRKVRAGTRSFLVEAAMTPAERERAIDSGADVARGLHDAGANVVAFGEMGIGNTASAALIMSLLCDEPVSRCAGRGAGLDARGFARKLALLEQARARAVAAMGGGGLGRGAGTADAVLAQCGGYEIAMMCGAMLAAAERGMLVVVDGFIASAAALAASAYAPAVLDYCIASHRSGEQGHALLLEHLGLEPLLDLGLRLGEGTGAALALPLLHSAVDFLNEMASFESAGVSGARAGGGAAA